MGGIITLLIICGMYYLGYLFRLYLIDRESKQIIKEGENKRKIILEERKKIIAETDAILKRNVLARKELQEMKRILSEKKQCHTV